MNQAQHRPAQLSTSLSTRILLFVVLSTSATVLTVSGVALEAAYSDLRPRVEQRIRVGLARVGTRVEAGLGAERKRVESLAAKMGGRGGPSWAESLRKALGRSDLVYGFHVLDSRGEALLEVGDAPALGETQRRALAASAPAQLRSLPAESGAHLVISTPIPAEGGGERVHLHAFLDPQGFRALLAAETGEGLLSGIVDGAGAFMAASEPMPGRARLGLPVADLLGAQDRTVRNYAPAAGRHLLGAARPLDGDSIFLVVEAPAREAFASLIALVTALFAVDLGLILLVTLLAYRVSAAVVRPIEALADGAREVALGHFDLQLAGGERRDEIGLLTRTFNDMMRKLRRDQFETERINQQLTERNDQLSGVNEILSQLSITDGLTKLHNHRFFQDYLTREIKRSQRTGEPLCILFVDIDDFKKLNDRLGHAAGDEVLARIAMIMSGVVRETDLLARYGGEEFVVLAVNTDLEGAINLAEKIRTAVAESSFIVDESMRPVRITVSVGVEQYSGDRKRFFVNADRALYRAKAEGKNCVIAGAD